MKAISDIKDLERIPPFAFMPIRARRIELLRNCIRSVTQRSECSSFESLVYVTKKVSTKAYVAYAAGSILIKLCAYIQYSSVAMTMVTIATN